jgi:hypothetical protein
MSENAGGVDLEGTTFKGRRAPGTVITDSTVELASSSLHVRTYRAGEGTNLPLVLFFPDAASGKKSGEWISSWLASAISGIVLEIRPKAFIASNLILDWAGGYSSTIGASIERIAVLGSGTGADAALEVFAALPAGRPASVTPVRLVMISPSVAAGSNGVPRGLPTVLLQVTRPMTGRHPAVALLEELTDAGSPARIIEYLGRERDWVASPRSVRSAHERLLDTITFLRRGLVDDSYGIVPNWNMH